MNTTANTVSMNVRIIIGTSAYAVITTPAKSMDIRLEPRRPAYRSLRETAAEYRAKAERFLRDADFIDRAAADLIDD